jgi:hypothetical protein
VLPPWRPAPVLLLRRPGVALAITAAALLIARPLGAVQPFTQATAGSALRHQLDASCLWTAGGEIAGEVPTSGPREVVAVVSARSLWSDSARSTWPRRVPWELVPVAAGVLLWALSGDELQIRSAAAVAAADRELRLADP